MGVSYLETYSKAKRDEVSTPQVLLAGARLLVDGNGLQNQLFEEVFACKPGVTPEAYYLNFSGCYGAYHQACLTYLTAFKDAGIVLDFVFDKNLGTLDERFKRATSQGRGQSKLDGLRVIQAYFDGEPLTTSLDKLALPRPQHLGRQFRAAVRELGYEILETEGGEADSVMAKLFHQSPGHYGAILARDTDFLMYKGISYIPFYDVDFDKGQRAVAVRVFTPEALARSLSLPRDKYLQLAMLVGTDYTKPINADIGLLSKLQLEPDLMKVAEWLRDLERPLSELPAFQRLLKDHPELGDAWDYNRRLFDLEDTAPTLIEEAASPAAPDPHLEALRDAVAGPRGLDPAFLGQYLNRMWWGPVGLEEVFPQGQGRPSVNVILRPLRVGAYEVLGIKGPMREYVRVGAQVVEDVAMIEEPKPELCRDGLLLYKFLARRGGEEQEREEARRDLERLIFGCFGKESPSEPQVQLLERLRLQQLRACSSQEDGGGGGGLYLAVLALQVMLLTSWASCPPADRLPKEAFITLVATLVECAMADPQLQSGESPPPDMNMADTWGLLHTATVGHWWAAAYSHVRSLVSLVGLKGEVVLDPRQIWDSITYYRFLTCPVEGEESLAMEISQLVLEASLDLVLASGLCEDDIFAAKEDSDASVLIDPLQYDYEEEQGELELARGLVAELDVGSSSEGEGRLPIMDHREDIIGHITHHELILIQGDTGCGKSTQVPQFIVEAFPGAKVVITQPTRMAAMGVAKRVASERGSELGQEVGFRIGGDGVSHQNTKILFVTAGWLLQLMVHEKEPTFSHIIIDEVHGRTIDGDLLCLVMKMLLDKWRGQVKVILMSATLQGDIYEAYYHPRHVPRLHVGAKLHHVEEVYLDDLLAHAVYGRLFTKRHQRLALEAACHNFQKKPLPMLRKELVDIAVALVMNTVRIGETWLIFIGGMADIDAMIEALDIAQHAPEHRGKQQLEVMVCHSLLPLTENLNLMSSNLDKARVVLATSMAESSVTLPACSYVVDFGFHKRIEYEQKEHRTVLKGAWISRASAEQRKGRTGRVCPGVVFRLYTASFFETLEPYDLPEMLTQVALRVKVLDFADVREALAACVQPPSVDQVDNALRSLTVMGALTKEEDEVDAKVTPMGLLMMSLGLDLEIARLVIFGLCMGCEAEAILLGSVLSVQDPFIMAHQSNGKTLSDFFEYSAATQRARDKFCSGLGSDPIGLILTYTSWLRAKQKGEQREFQAKHGLVAARISSLHNNVRTLTRRLCRPPFSADVEGIMEDIKDRSFDERLVSPSKLNLLRALLIGSFSKSLLVAKVKPQTMAMEDQFRTVHLVDMPPSIKKPEQVEEVLRAFGSIEKVQVKGGKWSVTFREASSTKPGSSHGEIEGGKASPFQVKMADETPDGSFTDLASPVKAIVACANVPEPGMEGYVPVGASPQVDARAKRAAGRGDGVKASSMMGGLKCKFLSGFKDTVQLSRSSVLKNAAVPVSSKSSSLYIVASAIQKIQSGQGISFRAECSTLVMFTPLQIALVLAAFMTENHLTLFRVGGGKRAAGVRRGLRRIGERFEGEEEDDDDNEGDGDHFCGIRVNQIEVRAKLPSNIVHRLNNFRQSISRCIERPVVVRPELGGLLADLLDLGRIQTPVRGSLGEAVVYQPRFSLGTSVLPLLLEQGTPDPPVERFERLSLSPHRNRRADKTRMGPATPGAQGATARLKGKQGSLVQAPARGNQVEMAAISPPSKVMAPACEAEVTAFLQEQMQKHGGRMELADLRKTFASASGPMRAALGARGLYSLKNLSKYLEANGLGVASPSLPVTTKATGTGIQQLHPAPLSDAEFLALLQQTLRLYPSGIRVKALHKGLKKGKVEVRQALATRGLHQPHALQRYLVENNLMGEGSDKAGGLESPSPAPTDNPTTNSQPLPPEEDDLLDMLRRELRDYPCGIRVKAFRQRLRSSKLGSGMRLAMETRGLNEVGKLRMYLEANRLMIPGSELAGVAPYVSTDAIANEGARIDEAKTTAKAPGGLAHMLSRDDVDSQLLELLRQELAKYKEGIKVKNLFPKLTARPQLLAAAGIHNSKGLHRFLGRFGLVCPGTDKAASPPTTSGAVPAVTGGGGGGGEHMNGLAVLGGGAGGGAARAISATTLAHDQSSRRRRKRV